MSTGCVTKVIERQSKDPHTLVVDGATKVSHQTHTSDELFGHETGLDVLLATSIPNPTYRATLSTNRLYYPHYSKLYSSQPTMLTSRNSMTGHSEQNVNR